MQFENTHSIGICLTNDYTSGIIIGYMSACQLANEEYQNSLRGLTNLDVEYFNLTRETVS